MSESNPIALLKQDDKKFKLSPKELIFKYLIFLPLFIISLGISLGVATIYLRYQIPYYNSGISILINEDRGSRGGSSSDALDQIVLFRPRTNMANEIEILKSATLMERVVRAQNLNTQYWVEGNFKRTETYDNRIFEYESISQKDTNSGYTVTLQFKDKNHFQVQGLNNQSFAAGDIIHGNHGDFRIKVVNEGGINPEYSYIMQWQPPFQAAAGIAGGLSIRQLNGQASILRIDLTTEIPEKLLIF